MNLLSTMMNVIGQPYTNIVETMPIELWMARERTATAANIYQEIIAHALPRIGSDDEVGRVPVCVRALHSDRVCISLYVRLCVCKVHGVCMQQRL